MSTLMSLVGALIPVPGCGPSCKEGLPDSLGRDAPDVSGSTGTTVVFGPGSTNGVGAPGTSSVLRPASLPPKISQV